jgi:Zn-dependent metalloprotease
MHTHICRIGHRHSIFCLLPPHVLREIAKRGNQNQRNAALDTLALDSTMRAQRATLQLLAPMVAPAVMAATAATAKVHRTIYTAANSQDLPGALTRSEGQATVADSAVNEAYDGLGATFDFYLEIFRRNSIDDRGLPLVASVHYGRNYDNAFWNGHQMVFGDGDGEMFNHFTGALDVIGHELTHGVTGSEVNLTYLQQSGALNESISDVFGSLVKQYKLGQTVAEADWLIGAGLLKFPNQALRSMKQPGTAYENELMGRDPQPADMAHYVQSAEDNGGVHINSGIPNRAFFLVADALKGSASHAWEKAGQIWYDTIRDARLKPSADFAAFAGRTVANAAQRYGTNSDEQRAVIDAWRTVGATPS